MKNYIKKRNFIWAFKTLQKKVVLAAITLLGCSALDADFKTD